MMNIHVVRALAKRDLRRYFGNPTGYVFITLFILLSAAAAFWRPRFFLNNLANLNQLNEVFPFVLVCFASALTMGVWSDERKQGTDELLLTLPARDVEIVLGKYLAVVAIYTIAVLLSLSHAAVLIWLGSPDPGLLIANYVGYWLAGVALTAVGMVASLMSSNATVAFVLAALLCSVPVGIDVVARTFNDAWGRRAAPLGVFFHFSDFATGVASVSGFFYFVALTGLSLYLNIVLLGRRRWRPQSTRLSMAFHQATRVLALAAALIAVGVLLARAGARWDATAERLYSLGDETRQLISALPNDRTVLIQAFVSPDVPAEYVQQQANLLGTLREVKALAGPKVEVVVHETEPYSQAAQTARERFGIVPRLVTDPTSARTDMQSMFLGVAFTSGSEEQIIPFLERGLSAEYEITRSIRVVARAARKRIGVIDTDAKVFGGVDFEGGRTRLPWATVNELRKQYEVVLITPWEAIQEKVDALLVVLPSTMLQREMDNVFTAIRGGVPALVIVDPVPAIDMRLAPAAAMAARVNPYADPGLAFARKNTGDVQAAMKSIGVNWPPTLIVWDSYRPHPDIGHLPNEVVFIGTGSGNPSAFNRSHAATSGLQELLLMYPGQLEPAATAAAQFEPLVQTGKLSGTVGYFQLVQPSPAGPVLNVNMPRQPQDRPFTLAAHVRSSGSNVIVIADLDFISDAFFEMRTSAATATTADNIVFFLNCIDVLAGDESFIALRKRRVRHRTLERLEAQTRSFIERRSREEQQAAAEAQAALDKAQEGLKKMADDIAKRPDVDAQVRQILARNLEETENRRLNVLRNNIELAKNAKIQASREAMEASVRRIQSTIRTTAVLLPPLPMLLVGIAIFFRQRRRERETGLARRIRGST